MRDHFLISNKQSRLMLLEENQIAFHSEDGLIFDGVKDYSRQIAEMIGLGSDSEFIQAGVSCISVLHISFVTSWAAYGRNCVFIHTFFFY